MLDTQQVGRHAIDTGAALGIAGVLAGLLPTGVAIVALIWYIVQIFESRTVQSVLRERRIRRYAIRKFRLDQETSRIEARHKADMLLENPDAAVHVHVHNPEA